MAWLTSLLKVNKSQGPCSQHRRLLQDPHHFVAMLCVIKCQIQPLWLLDAFSLLQWSTSEATVQSSSQTFMDHCAHEDGVLNARELKMEIICIFIPKCCASENNTFGRFIVEFSLSLWEFNFASEGFGLRQELSQVKKMLVFPIK